MDRSRKRAREEVQEDEAVAAAAGTKMMMKRSERQPQHAAEEALANGRGGVGENEPWQRPPGVFELPWLKCRNGLGLVGSTAGCGGGGGGWELRDVFFRSLVDGRSASVGFPGDRLSPPPSKRTMFDDVEAWLADAEVAPWWRSVLEVSNRARAAA